MIKNILVVCVGNICRSPMAEAIFTQIAPSLKIESAGIGALIGHGADPIAQQLMDEKGLDISSHRAKQINEILCTQNDLILVMETNHKIFIEKNFPITRGKVFSLCHSQKVDIPDPYRQDKEAFRYSLKLIEHGIQDWLQKIARL